MEVFYDTLLPHYHRAVVEVHDSVVYWQGVHPGGHQLAITRKDFQTTYQSLLHATWAFCEVCTTDNDKSIVEAIQVSQCKVVSDGSFKEGMGTAAWILWNSLTLISLTGKTKIPGEVED